MKNLVKRQWLFLFALVLTFSLASCGDDDNGPGNSASVGDDKISFKHGYIITDEDIVDADGETGSRHSIYLTSKGLTVDGENNELDGEGDVAAFILFSASNDELDEGTYELISTSLPGHATMFIMATEYNWNDGDPEFDHNYMGTYGTIKVSKSGSTYTFDIEVTSYTVNDGDDTEDGEDTIKGYYKGKLEVTEIGDGGARVSSPFTIF